MARKNLFGGLLDGKPDEAPANVLPSASVMPRTLSNSSAIGVVSRSFEEVKALTVVDIAVDKIDPSFITDRLDDGPEGHSDLVALIREHGQQVPILVRTHPTEIGRYQIVYGRRRLRAAAELGRPVKAVVKPLTDEQLVVAQGQENSARADLSFIERALFAAALEERGFGRDTIMAALAVDKTGLSRLISSAVKIPRDLIEAIGPAPKTGRDRWVELAARLEGDGAAARARELAASPSFAARKSDERFSYVFGRLTQKETGRSDRTAEAFTLPNGARAATLKDDETVLTLKIDKKASAAFAAYFAQSFPQIFADWKTREGA
ncbi:MULTISPECIES: plasmid partitioning protein RepB [Hansschlegelia]|uniref:Plasmid partitioning protein RepB n=1 Tax=Hansschlegelia zhihuaiae TaxID=405005 RepID=A0A4Q0MF04_9HYPH|nr:plasmid partitioning protein RepB [Hansschlegelia zhihuaiae]RXF71519.1 plasmid partitioning protein RepB [Hansschlegelia zhihuaiae]